MRKLIAGVALTAALGLGPIAAAGAQNNDPNDVRSVDNPVDQNDNGGFDDWGLLGLLGLAGLAGLARRDRHPVGAREREVRTGNH